MPHRTRIAWKGLGALWTVALFLAGVSGAARAEELSPNAAGLPPAFAGLPERGQNSAAGELFPDALGASVVVQREFRRALPSIYSYSQTAHYQNRADADLRISSDGAYASADEEELVSYSLAACPTSMCAPGSNWVMWDVPFTIKETRERQDGHLGYEQSVSGFATGVSRMLGEASAIGLAVGYDYRKLDGRDDYHMKDRADAFHAAVFGGTNVGHFFVDGYAGYSRTWHRTHRSVYYNPSGTIYDQNGANFNDTVLSAGLKANYVWILDNDMRITPSVGIDYSHARMGDFSEKHADSNTGLTSQSALRVEKSSFNTVAVPIVASANKTFSSGFLSLGGSNSLWTPEIRGGYIARFGSDHVRADVSSLLGAGGWSVKSSPMNDGYGIVGAGLKIKVRDKFIFAVDYNFSFAKEYRNHSLTGMYGVSF